jgi:hypothetical protein
MEKKASFSFPTTKSAPNKNETKLSTGRKRVLKNTDGNKQTNHLQTPELTAIAVLRGSYWSMKPTGTYERLSTNRLNARAKQRRRHGTKK